MLWVSGEFRFSVRLRLLPQNGFLSALPYLGGWLFSTLSGFAADSLIERQVFSITVVRKLFTVAGESQRLSRRFGATEAKPRVDTNMLPAAGMLLPAAFLVAVSYAGCSHILTVTFLTLSTATGGISASGVFINQIDIAPRWVSRPELLLKSHDLNVQTSFYCTCTNAEHLLQICRISPGHHQHIRDHSWSSGTDCDRLLHTGCESVKITQLTHGDKRGFVLLT